MKNILLIAISLLGFVPLHAQSIGPSIINAGGGTATINGETYDYSIGEMTLVHTASAGGVIVTQGLLQPNAVQNSIAEHSLNTFTNVYPNPTHDVLHIETQLQGLEKLNYRLWDIHGRLIIQKDVIDFEDIAHIELSLNGMAKGTYQLEIIATANGQLYKGIYSIIKS
jgi:hypothetical protein